MPLVERTPPALQARNRRILLEDEKDGLVMVALWLFGERDRTPWWHPFRRRWLDRQWKEVDAKIRDVERLMAEAHAIECAGREGGK